MKILKLTALFLLLAPVCFSQTTGGAGNANAWNFPGDFKRVSIVNITHLYGAMGFADSAQVIAATIGNYFKITQEGDSLYSTGVNRGLLFQGDSIKVPVAGDYEIHWSLSYSGANTDDYHIAIFVQNVEQAGFGETHRDMTTSNVGVSAASMICNCSANDWISLRIKNTQNNNDPTIVAGSVVVCGLYAN